MLSLFSKMFAILFPHAGWQIGKKKPSITQHVKKWTLQLKFNFNKEMIANNQIWLKNGRNSGITVCIMQNMD